MKFHIVTLFISVAVLVLICRLWYNNSSKCSTSFIYKTCEEYKKSALYNSFCHSICMENNVTIEECMSSTTFNKSVFAVKINDQSTILKVNMQWFNHVQHSLAKPLAMFNASVFFDDIVSKYFGSNCPDCKELVEKLIIMADADKNGTTSPTEAIWFGSLLLTQETFMLAALNESTSTVNLNGYCGALYAVEKVDISSAYLVDTSKAFTDFWGLPEFAEPIESFFKDILGELRDKYAWFETLHEYAYIVIKRLRQDKVPSLQQRIQFILGSLEMLYSLVSFEYGEVMLCDILFENIGFAKTEKFSSVKLTDLDEIFSVRKVFQNVSKNEKKTCVAHKDCLGENYDVGLYYHDACSPYCLNNSLCSQRPRKSNLAYMCESLFFDAIFNPVVRALSEQVMSNSIGSTIYWILKDCAKSTDSKTIDEYLTNIRTVQAKFRNVLLMLSRE